MPPVLPSDITTSAQPPSELSHTLDHVRIHPSSLQQTDHQANLLQDGVISHGTHVLPNIVYFPAFGTAMVPHDVLHGRSGRWCIPPGSVWTPSGIIVAVCEESMLLLRELDGAAEAVAQAVLDPEFVPPIAASIQAGPPLVDTDGGWASI
jgi:hypothetical protein